MGRTKSPFAILDKKYAKALYVGLSVVLFQQLTGQPSVLYYATQTFEAAGWSAQGASNIAVVVGVFKLFMTGIAVWKVDSLGRRPLLLGGVSLITLSLMVLALASPDFAGSGVEAAALFRGCYFLIRRRVSSEFWSNCVVVSRGGVPDESPFASGWHRDAFKLRV